MTDPLEMAMALLQAGRFADADVICRDALKSNPRNSQALCFLATSANARKEHRQALELLEKIRIPGLAAAHVERAVAYRALGMPDLALREARLAVEECHLRAPRPGTVLRILVGPGDVIGIQPGQPALLFAADGPQVVRATVEQEFAHRIQQGAPALVRDEADPTARWRGRVGRIASWYSQRRTVLHDPSQLSDVRTLECEILLEREQPALRLGQSVRVSIGPVR